MTKRYTVLQKKLKKLESELNQVFALPPPESETETLVLKRQRFAQDIRQRFLFLSNLLSAEVASRPTNPNPHLQHIALKLSQLEAAFHHWDTALQTPDHVGDEAEAGSTCSCTDSCFNDDGGETSTLAALEEAAEAEATAELSCLHGLGLEGFDDDDDEERLLPVAVAVAERSDEERKDGDRVLAQSNIRINNGVWFGKYYLGTLASGVVLGMGLMAVLMVRWCGCCFHYYYASDFSYCLSPT